MALSLRERFLAAESQFLTASTNGDDAVRAFADSWKSLHNDYTAAIAQQQVDIETQSAAQSIASRMAVLAECLLSLHISADKLRSTFKFDASLFEADADTPLVPPVQTIPSLSPSPSPPSLRRFCTGSSADQSLDVLSHQWLLQNLVDPYPSCEVKSFIAESCGCSNRDVQEWFANARRRIGWTTLCGEKFGGSRRLASEAAARAYAGVVDGDLSVGLRRAFLAVQANANSYRLDYAISGEKAVKDEDLEQSIRGVSVCDDLAGKVPTSLAPDSVDPFEEDEDTTPPVSIAGHKRRLNAEHFDVGLEHLPLSSQSSARPTKRNRLSPPPGRSDTQAAHIPSVQGLVRQTGVTELTSPQIPSQTAIASGATARAAMKHHPFDCDNVSTLGLGPHLVNAPSSVAAVSLRSRKRRVSDAADPNSSKRQRGPTLGPRKQAVSDPLPAGLGPHVVEVDDWSSPDHWVNMRDVTSSMPYDAELATLSKEQGLPFLLGIEPALSVSQLDVSDVDLVSATPDGFDFSTFGVEGDTSLASFDSETTRIHPHFQDSSAFSLLSSDGTSYSSCAPIDSHTPVDWDQDWSQFMDIINSLGSSPASSQSSLADSSTSFQFASDGEPSPSPDNITHTLFGEDPSFPSSDLLCDIGGFPSLHIPLEAMF